MGVMTGPPRSKPRCFLGSLHIAWGGGGWEQVCYPGPQVRVCVEVWEGAGGVSGRPAGVPPAARIPFPLPPGDRCLCWRET